MCVREYTNVNDAYSQIASEELGEGDRALRTQLIVPDVEHSQSAVVHQRLGYAVHRDRADLVLPYQRDSPDSQH